MAVVSRLVHATPEEVFDQLSDGWIYTSWVVGAAHVRAVDATWPQIGSAIHHKVGAWPMLVADSTTVADMGRPHTLVLQARARPFGEARVELTLVAEDGGTRVTMHESPVAGPGRWLSNPLQEALLRARNTESLARLASLAENRGSPTG